MTAREEFNLMLNSCEHPRAIYNVLESLANTIAEEKPSNPRSSAGIYEGRRAGMSNNEILLKIEDPVVQMRMYINRARLVMRDLMMNYFHNVDYQTVPVGDNALEARIFQESTIRAEIIEDALYYMETQLRELEQLKDKLEEGV